MNDNLPFNVEPIGNCSPNGGHRRHWQFIKQGPHPLPQEPFTARFVPGGLKELAGQLLGLVNRKGQHHQHGQNRG